MSAENCVYEIAAEVSDVQNGCYVLNASNGLQYKLPVGSIEVETGQLVQIEENVYLKLVVPENDNDTNSQNDLDTTELMVEDNQSNNARIAEWANSATKLLIQLYKDHKPLVEERKLKSLKQMWLIVQEKMTEQGYSFTAQQCESRWKTLERAFKKKTENNKQTGRSRKNCPYEKELSDILLQRHSIVPPVVMNSNSIEQQKPNSSSEAVSVGVYETGVASPTSSRSSDPLSRSPSTESVNNSCSKPTTSVGSSTRNTSILRELQELRKLISEQNKRKQDIEEQKIAQRTEILTQLKRKNELLQALLENFTK